MRIYTCIDLNVMPYIHGKQQTIMPDDYVELCLPFGTLRTYAATSTIHDRGSKNKGLSVVVSGEVKIGNYGLDGSYQITITPEKVFLS